MEILAQTKDGLLRTLYHRLLTPGNRTEDRGPQEITLTLDHPPEGELIFRIDPGPASNLTNDWAYWAAIEIR